MQLESASPWTLQISVYLSPFSPKFRYPHPFQMKVLPQELVWKWKQCNTFLVNVLYTQNPMIMHNCGMTFSEKVLLGDNEGLYMLDITDDGLYKFSDRDIRKVSQIMIIKEEGLIALLAGKGWFV